jgi:hypothetical protein
MNCYCVRYATMFDMLLDSILRKRCRRGSNADGSCSSRGRRRSRSERRAQRSSSPSLGSYSSSDLAAAAARPAAPDVEQTRPVSSSQSCCQSVRERTHTLSLPLSRTHTHTHTHTHTLSLSPRTQQPLSRGAYVGWRLRETRRRRSVAHRRPSPGRANGTRSWTRGGGLRPAAPSGERST